MIRRVFLLVAVLVFAVSFVSANFGISSSYFEERPLVLRAGEFQEVEMRLINYGGEGDFEVEVEMIEGFEVAEIVGESLVYDLSVNSEESVNIRVEVPDNAKEGEVYDVKLMFKPISKEEVSGNIKLGMKVGKSFSVIVGGNEPETAPLYVENKRVGFGNLVFYFLGSIIVLVIFIFLVIRVK